MLWKKNCVLRGCREQIDTKLHELDTVMTSVGVRLSQFCLIMEWFSHVFNNIIHSKHSKITMKIIYSD